MTQDSSVLEAKNPNADSPNESAQPNHVTRLDASQQVSRKTVLQTVAIGLIWPNPENPRSAYTPEDIQTLAANLKASGQRTPVKLVPLTDQEKFTTGELYQYKLLGGHMRREAALTLGWDSLDALILDLSPEEAELEMILDNRIIELPWLDQYKIIEAYKAKNPKMSQEEIGARLGMDQSTISRALKTMKALNQASRDLIYAGGIKSEGIKRVTQSLAALEDPEKVEQALKVALDRKLTEAQAKKLVEWVKAGNPAETYQATTPAPKAQVSPAHSVQAVETPSEPDAHEAVAQATLAPASHTGSSYSVEPVQPNHVARLDASQQAPAKTSTHAAKSNPSTGSEMGSAETAIYEAIAGISVIAKIKAKIKKGERPNFFEVLLLAGHQLWSILAWLGKHSYKLAKPVGKFVWKLTKSSVKVVLKALGRTVYNLVRVVMGLAVLALLGWFGWELYQNGFHPRAALMDIGKTLWQYLILLGN